MIERDKLLDKNLEHIRHALEQSPRAYAVRTETALEISTHLTFKEDVEESQHCIKQHQPHPDQEALQGDSEPLGHEAQKEGMKPSGSN